MMRAKMKVSSVTLTEHGELLKMDVVTNGTDEDNNFSQYTPSGSLELAITNKELKGKFQPGQAFYVDFTAAE